MQERENTYVSEREDEWPTEADEKQKNIIGTASRKKVSNMHINI